MKHARLILSYLGSFFLALVLAIIIWLTATQEQDPTRSQFIQLDVDLAGKPENSIIIQPQNPTVQIRVEGPESTMNEMSFSDFNAFIDLSQVPFGQLTSVMVELNSSAAGGLELSTPIPETVEVLMEQQVAREIPVELDIRGDVARGHIQGEPFIDPPFITIVGPESDVEQLDFALATVFLNDARETNVGEHRPIFYDEQGRVASISDLEISTDRIQVTIPVEESDGFADKLITVDWVGDPAPGYRLLSVSVEPPSVLVKGLPARVNALTRLQTDPVDITGLTESFTQQVTLDFPPGVSLDQDQEVFVSIEIEPILTTDIRERDVELLGVSADMEASPKPEHVRVVLFGPLAALDTLVDDDVRVTVDLFGLVSGTHSLEPVVDIPERGVEVRSIRPGSITVVVTRTITGTDEITPTLPVTGNNRTLFNAIAKRNQVELFTTADSPGDPASFIERLFQALFLVPDQFANIPKRIIFL